MSGLSEELLKWLINNGVAVAVLILGIWALRDVLQKLVTSINTLNVSAEGNNQALRDILLFVSQNMSQVVAHRQAIEGENAPHLVPGDVPGVRGDPTWRPASENSGAQSQPKHSGPAESPESAQRTEADLQAKD